MSDILSGPDGEIPKDVTRVAEPSREEQLPKRFYKSAEVSSDGDEYRVELDGRPVKTPGRNQLSFASMDIAHIVAAEWEAQGERIDPMTMPATRLVNTALDGVANDPQAVKEDVTRFAATDMLCYRAERPESLVARQRELWDPVLDWASGSLGVHLILAEGVMHVSQPPESIAAFGVHVGQIGDPLVLSGLHVMTTLTGSAILALAVLKGELSDEQAWQAAHVDEDWNISQWGEDAEAAALRDRRWIDMQVAARISRAAMQSGQV